MGLLDRIAKKPPPSGPPDSIDVNERHEVVITWPGGPQVIVPGHCTGWKAMHELSRQLPEAYLQTSVGTRLHFSST